MSNNNNHPDASHSGILAKTALEAAVIAGKKEFNNCFFIDITKIIEISITAYNEFKEDEEGKA